MKLHEDTERVLRAAMKDGLEEWAGFVEGYKYFNIHQESVEQTREIISGLLSQKYKVSIIVEEVK